MGDRDAPAPRVLHLDHTSAPGGAQYALVRMLGGGPTWRPLLLTPPSGRGGVFATLPVAHHVAGVRQPAGVSSGRPADIAIAAVALLLQAFATRWHRAFRTADVVDANSARAAAYGALAARTSRKPFVVHVRDIVDVDALGAAGYAMMTRVVLPRADAVIANSRATLASAQPYLRADAETAVIPSASGLGAARHQKRGTRAGAPFTIGLLARIDPWKGQDLLITAFAQAFADDDALLEIAGAAQFGHDGYLEELKDLAAKLGVGHRVRFLGHVEDVPELLAGWDAAVQFSTRPEPLGQNVLQYLAAGVATVVANEGGPMEWVRDGENGLVVAARDPDALAAALRRLRSDTALRTRLAAAAASTPGLLTDEQVAHAHADLYRRVLSARRGAGEE